MDITLISHFFDARLGGTGVHSKLIYEGLKKKENTNLNLLSQKNSCIPFYNPLTYVFFTSFELKFLLNKEKYQNRDIYHALTPFESKYINKRKGVASVLDFIPLSNKNNLTSSMFAKYFNKSIKDVVKCERIVANNSAIKKELISKYGADEYSIEVISPPINGNFCVENLEHDTFNIGTISYLTDRKRFDILINSFLDANISNSKLLIGGKGPELNHLIELAAGDDRIKFLGFVPDDEMNDFYNSLDVFVFPTLVEGYGMPMVEAMGCGKPVITLSDSVIPSDIKDRTIICDKNDLCDVLKSESFDFDKKSNLDFYKQHSVDKISDKIMNVYESI